MLSPDLKKLTGFAPPWLLTIAIIFFIVLAFTASGFVVFNQIYQDKIYPNVYLGDLNLGGLTPDRARLALNSNIDRISRQGVILSFKNKSAVLPAVASSGGPDSAYQIISFNTDAALAQAAAVGHDPNLFINLIDAVQALIFDQRLKLSVIINEPAVEKFIFDNFPEASNPARDAALSASRTGEAYEFSVTPEKIGRAMDLEAALGALKDNLSRLDLSPIELTTVTQYPKILSASAVNADGQARNLLSAAPLTLIYGEKTWTLNREGLADLLALKTDPDSSGQASVGLDLEKTKIFLKGKIAAEIDRPALEAKFEIKNGKVSEFQNGQDGLVLDLDASLAAMETELASGNNKIELAVKTQPVLTRAGDLNAYGVKEIIGLGTSNFAGSPKNRRHNIKVGAASVNGTLIKPGEEFSLLKTIGQVASSTGYLPELVIKEGKTTPEYGGGLCQIGTTVFRAALASGLPVTMRRNHSYRVVYYEPAGTDATIYDPWPDFRFINDTASYVLIQSKFSGDNLSFEFWGSRDGRIVEQAKSVIYNIVKPEPTKIIETLDLKPGVKKCTESAHNGADAYFDYKVTYADGTVKAKRFSSHYVPWQEVCLLGVEQLSPPPETASSTPVI